MKSQASAGPSSAFCTLNPLCTFMALLVIGGEWIAAADSTVKNVLKTESFDADPKWEAFNNRLKPDPKDIHKVVQNFGYSDTHFAGDEKGELGGQIQRSKNPAFYADKIPLKSLNDKLTASGKFLFTSSQSSAGIWFGWFRARQETGAARPTSGLGLNMDFEKNGGRLAVRMSNSLNQFCGAFVTPYIPGKFRPSPLKPNTRYSWKLSYDPLENHGDGRFEFSIKCDTPDQELRAQAAQLPDNLKSQLDIQKDGSFKHGSADFDQGMTFAVDLPKGFKEAGASFDRFGLMSNIKEGNAVNIYFDDLHYDGKSESFTKDPGWDGSGNRTEFEEGMPTGYHDFGYRADTHFAGGRPGEFGGTFWRLTKGYGYYADKIGTLTLNDPLEASGKVVLQIGTPDSEIAFGWFNSSQKEVPVHLKNGRQQEGHLDKTDNFLGVYLAGPTRLGRCMLPSVITAKGTRDMFNRVDESPRPTPKKVYDWTMKYDPSAADGRGALTVTLGDATATLILDPGVKKEGATFDRFGFFPSGGGGMVQIYFDDLKYTVGRGAGS